MQFVHTVKQKLFLNVVFPISLTPPPPPRPHSLSSSPSFLFHSLSLHLSIYLSIYLFIYPPSPLPPPPLPSPPLPSLPIYIPRSHPSCPSPPLPPSPYICPSLPPSSSSFPALISHSPIDHHPHFNPPPPLLTLKQRTNHRYYSYNHSKPWWKSSKHIMVCNSSK